MIRVTWFGSFLLAGLGPAVGSPASTPPLQSIIDQTLAHAEAQQHTLQSMQYDQTAQIDQLDGRDKIIHHDMLHMIVRPGAKPPQQIISYTEDNLPSEPYRPDVQAKGRDVEDNKHTFTLRALVDRFTITLVGEDQIAGQPAYVVAFTPKPNQPYHDDTEKVVDQLQGRMWISARTYNVLRTEASLAHPVSVAWFLASVPTLDFHYATSDTDVGFAPCQVQVTVRVNAPFFGYHQRQIIDMANFVPRSPGEADHQKTKP